MRRRWRQLALPSLTSSSSINSPSIFLVSQSMALFTSPALRLAGQHGRGVCTHERSWASVLLPTDPTKIPGTSSFSLNLTRTHKLMCTVDLEAKRKTWSKADHVGLLACTLFLNYIFYKDISKCMLGYLGFKYIYFIIFFYYITKISSLFFGLLINYKLICINILISNKW